MSAPVTPPRRTATTTRPSLTHPALAPLRLNSSSPVPLALAANSVGAPVHPKQHVHFETTGELDDQDHDSPPSPTDEAVKSWSRKSRAERRGMSRSEDCENVRPTTMTSQGSPPTRSGRRATFSKVVSSQRTSLAGLGHPKSHQTITSPPRASAYVPPHLRYRSASNASSASYNPLAAFDRSACPEPEDSFYTNVSLLSLNSSSASSTTTSPNTSRILAHKPSPLALGSPAGSPFSSSIAPTFNAQAGAYGAYSLGPTPSSPTTLISRGPYLDPARHSHPHAIPEEDELERKSWADEVEADEQAGHVTFETLLSADEEAALGFDVDDEVPFEGGAGGVVSRASVIKPPETAQEEINGDVCSGCGMEKNLAFVTLLPCSHPLCHICINALINGAAHKPPRPSDCFACAAHVESVAPAFEGVSAVRGGVGLIVALKDVLVRERATGSAGAEGKSDAVVPHEGGDAAAFSRSRRRRSSVVAAAIAATILVAPVAEGQVAGRSRSSTVGTVGSLTSLPSSFADADSFQLPSSPVRRLSNAFTAPPSALEALTSTPPRATGGSSTSALPPAIDWPVVRLDNVPWEATAAEVEAWVGEGNLASDLDDEAMRSAGSGGDGNEKAKRVTLAVHILCNRADGRTLNQAYLECSSRAAARTIVRLKDGSKLRHRPVHVSLASQGEFLTTLFPTYTPGFASLEPNSNVGRSKWAAPIPLLVQTELTGLLNLCRLESAHSKKVAERPFFNIVSLIEKMPWSFPDTYNSQAVVRLYNTACAAIEILGNIKHGVREWRDILTVLVDAILHCPVFRPQQKQKAVRLAANIGFGQAGSPRKPSFSAPSTSSFTPASLKESYVGTAPDKAFLAAKQADGAHADEARLVEVGLPSPRFSSASPGEEVQTEGKPAPAHRRRRSSVAAQLNIDKALVESVAAALGIALDVSGGGGKA
ncbi:hypothetical protein JCM10207_002595 [Rhodosporidiobolus poonsookiae]